MSGNPNAARGARWELAVVRYLQETLGRAAHRPHQEGFKDVGDVHISPWVIQAKDEARHTFSSYVDDAELQARNAGEPFGVAVVKRRTVGVGRAYAVLSLSTFRAVVSRLLDAEARLLRADPASYDQHLEELP